MCATYEVRAANSGTAPQSLRAAAPRAPISTGSYARATTRERHSIPALRATRAEHVPPLPRRADVQLSGCAQLEQQPQPDQLRWLPAPAAPRSPPLAAAPAGENAEEPPAVPHVSPARMPPHRANARTYASSLPCGEVARGDARPLRARRSPPCALPAAATWRGPTQDAAQTLAGASGAASHLVALASAHGALPP